MDGRTDSGLKIGEAPVKVAPENSAASTVWIADF
jgi:hypothetical protein